MHIPYPVNETEGTGAIIGRKTRGRAQGTVWMRGRRLAD